MNIHGWCVIQSAAFLVAALIATVVWAELLLSQNGNERKYGSVCSDIREIVTVYGYYVCASFAIIHALLRFALRWIDESTVAREASMRKEFFERYANVWPFSTEIWHRAKIAAIFI